MLHLAKNKAIYLLFMLFVVQACKPSPHGNVQASESPHHGNIRFDVTMPKAVRINGRFDYSVSMTNVSNIPIIVPDYLLGGRGIRFAYTVFDVAGNEVEPSVIFMDFYMTRKAMENTRIKLKPGGKQSSIDGVRTSKVLFLKPGRYRMVFTWDGFLDGDIEGEFSRFSCERWVEVTK